MPTIGIYVPSIGINSGFRLAFWSVGGSGGLVWRHSNVGDRYQPAFKGPGRAFKSLLRAVEWHR